MMQGETNPQRSLRDALVVIIALPLLITSSVLLHSSMHSDWVRDANLRWRILGLGLSLLFVSILVCLYATHRLGLCIWARRQRHVEAATRTRRRTISSRGVLPAPLISTESQMQLMAGGELPPSYDSVIRSCEFPPPYCALILQDEKAEVTRSTSTTLKTPGTG